MTDARKGMLAWAAVIVPVWIVMILCTHWEPVAQDGWFHWERHHTEAVSFGKVIDFAVDTYLHNNPRLGQVVTYLLYTPGPWHSIVTPLVELALFYLLALLVLGRWPCPRRVDDALLFAVILALSVRSVPSFGMMLFYRPFTGNYLYGLVISLALVAPYRLHYESPRAAAWWWAPALFVLGVIAGVCNEHTGPAFTALLAVAVVVFWRRGEGLVPWALAGLAGLIAGGVALYVAPGQHMRYGGLATQSSLFGRIAERGLAGNWQIIETWLAALLPMLVVVCVAGLAARLIDKPPAQPAKRRTAEIVLLAVALAITATLLLSPKQGSRLYLASVVLACAALAGWLTAQVASRWTRAALALVCAVALLHAGWRMTSAYQRLDREFRARMAVLEAAPPNSAVELHAYTVKRSRWSFGDDLLNESARNVVAAIFGLALIKLDQRAPTTPALDELP